MLLRVYLSDIDFAHLGIAFCAPWASHNTSHLTLQGLAIGRSITVNLYRTHGFHDSLCIMVC